MLKPRADYILVRPLPRVASRIIEVILHEEPNLGEVIAVGPGKRNKKGVIQPLAVKPGDIIRFMEWKGMFPEWRETPEGPAYVIVQEADIAAIEEPDEAQSQIQVMNSRLTGAIAACGALLDAQPLPTSGRMAWVDGELHGG